MRNLLLLTLSALGLISISSFHLSTTITRPQIRINAKSESNKIKIKTKFALVASVFGSVLSLPLPAFASASASASPPLPPPPQSLSRFLQKTYKKHATTLSPGLDKIYSLPTFTVVTPWSTPFTNPDRNSNSNSEGGRAGGAVLHFLDLSDAESSRSEFHQQEGLQGINGNIQITRLGKAMRNVLAKGVPSGQKGDGGNKIEQMVYKIVGSSLGRQQAAKVLKAQGRGAKVPDIPIFYVGGVTLKGGKIPMFMRLDQVSEPSERERERERSLGGWCFGPSLTIDFCEKEKMRLAKLVTLSNFECSMTL